MKLHHIGKSRSAAALWRRRALQILSGAVLAAAMPLAQATPFTLTSWNSTLTVNPSNSAGISNWTVDGVNQLDHQWFWGRVGDTGGEASLNVLAPLSSSVAANIADLYYGSTTGGLSVELTLVLHGGVLGSKQSDLGTTGTLRFSNNTNHSVKYHAFQYSDFDLSGTPGNDTVVTTNNGETFVQSDGGMILRDSAGATPPDHWEIAPYSTLLASLIDGSPTTLSDTGNGMVGDVTYAREWDFTLPANGGSFQISLDQNITVPDPGTVLLLGAGMLGLAGAGWRNRRKNQAMDRN